MLIKPVYDAYLAKWLSNQNDENFDVALLTPHEFVQLPYHRRLFLAGAYIKLKPVHRGVNITCCRPLDHYKAGQLIPAPDCSIFYDTMAGYSLTHGLNDVFLLGSDNEPYMLFPFEYEILLTSVN
jgi:hypothetical protein